LSGQSVDLAGDKAEIADQQVAGELAETDWSQGDAPRRGELAADDRLQQVPALIENRHGSHTQGSPSLGRKAGGRVGYVDFAGDVLHVERDESERADRAGRRECAGTEAHRGEGAVEYVDAAGPGLVGGVQLRLGLVNGEPAVVGPGVVTWMKAVGPVSQAEIVPFRFAKMKCAEPPFPPFPTGSSRGWGFDC